MNLLREYIKDILLEDAEVSVLMRDVDDILDDAIRDAAPEIVNDIREREVDEDIDEFIDGAIHGDWDRKELDYADPPSVGDPAEVTDAGDNLEVSEMYRLGYLWGWDNPNKIEGGEAIPDAIRAEMIEHALENFKSRVTEEFVINALEKSTGYVKKQMGDVHHLLMKAKEKFGWKFAPILVSIEVVEHAVLPTVLGAIHPIFYGLAAVPTVEILAASALAIAKARMPSAIPEEIPPGHLDWYEAEYQGSTNESMLRECAREMLAEYFPRRPPVKKRKLLRESNLSGRTIEGLFELLDGYADNTWIFFDTETTGFQPRSAQLTEIAAVAVDPNTWTADASVLGEFNEKIKLSQETLDTIETQSTEERDPKKMGVTDILSMTRYGESGRNYGEEQDILDQFFEFVASFPNPLLVAQNAAFDMKFVNVRADASMPQYPVLDTQQLMEYYLLPLLKTQTQAEGGDEQAQELLDSLYVKKRNWGYHSVSMGVVSNAYGINVDDWHNALADVRMMMEMYKNVVDTIRRGMGTDISAEQGRTMSRKKRKKRR